MRPSNQEGIIAVLDTLPECKVVLDALEDPNFRVHIQQDDMPLAESTAIRFRMQTRREQRPISADAYADTEWIRQPTFKIQAKDVDIIVRAARRTLQQRSPLDRFYNRLTKRTQAAKTILWGLLVES